MSNLFFSLTKVDTKFGLERPRTIYTVSSVRSVANIASHLFSNLEVGVIN